MSLPAFLETRLQQFQRERLDRHGGRNVFLGRQPGPNALRLQSNDYLALSREPQIVEAQVAALRAHGSGPQMSAVFLYECDGPFTRLQRASADYTGYESAVLCQSGYAANVGLLQSLAGRGASVYLDRFAHMSLWEGAHSGGATPRMFRHNDPEHLRSRLRRYGPGVVAVDAIYSAHGAAAPLREIAEVASEFDSLLVVDESHSLGVLGPGGAGLVAAAGLQDRAAFVTASLAKAFASRAGLVLGPGRALAYFPWESRPAIFSTMLEPHDAARLAATLAFVQSPAAEARRLRLQELGNRLRNACILQGYMSAALSASPIIPLLAGTEEKTIQLRDALEDHDVFASVFVRPTTPPERTLLRLSLHAALADADLEQIISALAAVRDDVRPWTWPDPFG